jgi:hypothetical protein
MSTRIHQLTFAVQQLARMFWNDDSVAFRETTRAIVRSVLSEQEIEAALEEPRMRELS